MAYLICCEYPAHPPADGSSTAKGSADTVLVVTLQFARCSFSVGPGFVACCCRHRSVATVDWHNIGLQILTQSSWYHAQHSTAYHTTAQHSTAHHSTAHHNRAFHTLCDALNKNHKERNSQTTQCNLPADCLPACPKTIYLTILQI